MFQNLEILRMFGFYSLKFGSIWILLPKVSEFSDVKSKYFQTLEGKIQVLKHQGENLNTPNFIK